MQRLKKLLLLLATSSGATYIASAGDPEATRLAVIQEMRAYGREAAEAATARVADDIAGLSRQATAVGGRLAEIQTEATRTVASIAEQGRQAVAASRSEFDRLRSDMATTAWRHKQDLDNAAADHKRVLEGRVATAEAAIDTKMRRAEDALQASADRRIADATTRLERTVTAAEGRLEERATTLTGELRRDAAALTARLTNDATRLRDETVARAAELRDQTLAGARDLRTETLTRAQGFHEATVREAERVREETAARVRAEGDATVEHITEVHAAHRAAVEEQHARHIVEEEASVVRQEAERTRAATERATVEATAYAEAQTTFVTAHPDRAAEAEAIRRKGEIVGEAEAWADPAQKDRLAAMEKGKAEARYTAEQKLERFRHTNNMARIKAVGEQVQAGLKTVGSGMYDFVNDRQALMNTTGALVGTYAAYKGVKLGFAQVEKYLAKPNIIKATNAPTVGSMMGKAFNALLGVTTQKFPLFRDVALDQELSQRVEGIKHAMANIKHHGGFFRNFVFWGASGTGKTMIAEALANEVDCYYVLITGSALFELPKREALMEVDHLFKWMNAQSKPVLLIVDEAEGLFMQRSAGMSEDKRDVLTHIMSHMGTESKKYAVVALTNRPQEFDEAMKTRFPVRIEISRPALQQRIDIINKNIVRMLKTAKIDTSIFTAECVREMGQKTKGMCGRDIMYLVAGIRDAVFASDKRVLTRELLDHTIALSLKDFAQQENGFERTNEVAN